MRQKSYSRFLATGFFTLIAAIVLVLWMSGRLSLPAGFLSKQLGQPAEQHANGDNDDADAAKEVTAVKLTSDQKSLIGLTTEPVVLGSMKETLALTGEVGLDQDHLARVTCPVTGVITEIVRTLGDYVKKGDILAVAGSRELAEAKADYLAATTKVTLTESAFSREKELWQKEISSQQDFLEAKQAMDEARVAVRLAKQKLLALRLSPTELGKVSQEADTTISSYSVRAPIDGWIIDRQAVLGDQASDKELFTICDLTTVWVQASAYTDNISSLEVGQSALINTNAYPGKVFSGNLVWISPSIDEATRTLKVRIAVPNPELVLRQGMFVEVALVIATRQDVLLVPRSSIIANDSAAFVFVENKDAEGYEKREVKLGTSLENQAEVLEGVQQGERIVTTGTFALDAELKKSGFADED